jgi:hypothetical protein
MKLSGQVLTGTQEVDNFLKAAYAYLLLLGLQAK